MGFKAKGDGLSAGGSERRPCVESEGSEGICGVGGSGEGSGAVGDAWT